MHIYIIWYRIYFTRVKSYELHPTNNIFFVFSKKKYVYIIIYIQLYTMAFFFYITLWALSWKSFKRAGVFEWITLDIWILVRLFNYDLLLFFSNE